MVVGENLSDDNSTFIRQPSLIFNSDQNARLCNLIKISAFFRTLTLLFNPKFRKLDLGLGCKIAGKESKPTSVKGD
jgi:hypothetical protein